MRRSCGAPPKEAPEPAERGIGNGRSPCEHRGAMPSAFCRVQWRASGQAPRGEAIVVAAPIERTASDAAIRQPRARARKAGRTERANHVSEHRPLGMWLGGPELSGTLKVYGFRSFGWAPRSLKELIEIFPAVPCSPSNSHGFSDYTRRLGGWGPLTSAGALYMHDDMSSLCVLCSNCTV